MKRKEVTYTMLHQVTGAYAAMYNGKDYWYDYIRPSTKSRALAGKQELRALIIAPLSKKMAKKTSLDG